MKDEWTSYGADHQHKILEKRRSESWLHECSPILTILFGLNAWESPWNTTNVFWLLCLQIIFGCVPSCGIAQNCHRGKWCSKSHGRCLMVVSLGSWLLPISWTTKMPLSINCCLMISGSWKTSLRLWSELTQNRLGFDWVLCGLYVAYTCFIGDYGHYITLYIVKSPLCPIWLVWLPSLLLSGYPLVIFHIALEEMPIRWFTYCNFWMVVFHVANC